MTDIQTTATQEAGEDLLQELDDLGGPPATPPAVVEDPRGRRRRRIIAWLLVVALVLFGAVAAWYLLNRKPLSELPGLDVDKVPTYKTALYGVEKPLGVAVSLDGSLLYVTQSGTKPAAFILDRDGNSVGRLKPPAADKGYHVPVYVAVHPTSGDVYVGDRAAGKVYVYDRAGTYRSTFTPKDKKITFSPLGLGVSADGTVYVADASSAEPKNHRILVFAPDGSLVKTLGKGELNYPNAIVPGAQDAIYVTDSNNGRVVVFDSTGAMTTLLARGIGDGDLGLPRGMALDDQGRLFVVDTTDQQVRVFTTGAMPTDHPAYVGSFGDQGREDATFLFPNGVATDTRGRVYVADRENNRIQVWGY
ncbi:SMP-30/gluconolactonase/LRE family protein [Intrasporangium calvum]|uniref:SMP-30/gluconolactonase/LRE family protein n=1 Tax=Intrasporangium calvum TaxID=53358 RepID=A0ABT5GBQ7_9MICO|nr:SMP-30/gluconolactonase/LRE family protein [Intrasporangium calvum]MDC5695714.1 SMP-30/gluconolactonase/LRE family protein [Intrasporangium calvum]